MSISRFYSLCQHFGKLIIDLVRLFDKLRVEDLWFTAYGWINQTLNLWFISYNTFRPSLRWFMSKLRVKSWRSFTRTHGCNIYQLESNKLLSNWTLETRWHFDSTEWPRSSTNSYVWLRLTRMVNKWRRMF